MSRTRRLAHGQVWWAELPGVGRRPAVVLTRQDALGALPRVLIATATTHVRDLPTEVALSRQEDGVPRDCVLNLDLPEQAYRSQLVEYITTLSGERMAEVCSALALAVSCSSASWR